jgi:hypothetical protein
MIVKQEIQPPSNALLHARARTVCFRDLSHDEAVPPGTGRRTPPARLQLVAYDDGTYGILLNGRPLPGSPWPEDQLDRCIDAFQRIGRVSETRVPESPELSAYSQPACDHPHEEPGYVPRGYEPRERTRICAPTSASPASITRQ